MARAAPARRSGAVTWKASSESAVAEQLGVDRRAALLCVFELLEHEYAAALADDEAVAIGVERAARPLGSSFRATAHGWR